MMTKRSSYDIIAEIAEASLEGACFTNIMYACQMSFSQMKNFIPFLLKVGILEEMPPRGRRKTSKVIYKTTNKGKLFLVHYSYLKNLLKEEQRQLLPLVLH